MDLYMIVSNHPDIGGWTDDSVAENRVSVPYKDERFISFQKILDRILCTQSFNEQAKVLPREKSGRV